MTHFQIKFQKLNLENDGFYCLFDFMEEGFVPDLYAEVGNITKSEGSSFLLPTFFL